MATCAECPYCHRPIPVTVRKTFYRHNDARFRNIVCYGSGEPVDKPAFVEEEEVIPETAGDLMAKRKAHFLTQGETLTLRNYLTALTAIQLDERPRVRLEVEGNTLTFQVDGWHALRMPLDLKQDRKRPVA